MQLFRRGKDAAAQTGTGGLPAFHPSTVICDWGKAVGPLTIEQLRSGICITGATGSGKTSTARHLCEPFLEAGFGFVILTAKPEEAALWKGYIERAGRQEDLIEVTSSGRWRYNFLAEEAARTSEGGGLTINLTSLLMEVAGVLSRGAGTDEGGGGTDQKFWTDSLSHLLMNTIDLAQFARLPLTLRTLRELVNSAPHSLEQSANDSWREGSKCYQAILTAAGLAEHADEATRVNVEECATFFLQEWATLNDKTRSTIALMLGMLVRPFLTKPLYRIFSTDTNVRPEDAAQGKILLINIPSQIYKNVGISCGVIWKFCAQMAIIRRQEPKDGTYLRPVVIYSDEAQNYISDFDYTYQAVARSAGGITCYIFQNREALIANIGNEYKVDSLLSNLQLKLFCQNTGQTATWASELIGEHYTKIAGTSVNRSGQEVSSTAGVSVNEELRPYIQASRFASLKRGGPYNDFRVEVVLYKGGHVFEDGKPFQIITFDQR
jgi:hypothetical protein